MEPIKLVNILPNNTYFFYSICPLQAGAELATKISIIKTKQNYTSYIVFILPFCGGVHHDFVISV